MVLYSLYRFFAEFFVEFFVDFVCSLNGWTMKDVAGWLFAVGVLKVVMFFFVLLGLLVQTQTFFSIFEFLNTVVAESFRTSELGFVPQCLTDQYNFVLDSRFPH